MFKNPSPVSSSKDEGVVTEIDPIRKLCKVKTVSGQNLTGVKWSVTSGGSNRAGDRHTPHLGDQVYITNDLGYPMISGGSPKLQNSENTYPLAIDSGETLVDTGNFSEAGSNVIGDQNAPPDMLVGDRIISSQGGGLIAVLRAGSVLLRSSRLAEIFISKWDDVVRVVSRNWEHFTDGHSDIVKNLQGRVYRYIGYTNNSNSGKISDYQYIQHIGDVALSEAVGEDYQNAEALPAASDVIYKEQVTQSGGEVLSRELHLDGTHDLVVKAGGVFTRIKSTNGAVQITYGDTNVITVNQDQISLKKGGDQISVVLTASSVKAAYNGAEHTLDSNGVSSTFSGHYVKVTGGGVSFG